MTEHVTQLRTFQFGGSDHVNHGPHISLKIQEVRFEFISPFPICMQELTSNYWLQLTSQEYGSYTWASAIYLAEYCWYLGRETFQGKLVLELGCGTALPSLVCAALGARCLLTDDQDAAPILKNANICLMTNNPVHYFTGPLNDDCSGPFEPIFLSSSKVAPFSWACFSPQFLLNFVDPQDATRCHWPDLIIAADCFYDNSGSFDAIFATLAYFFEKNPNCKFITSYQVRSPQSSLIHLVDKWNFVAEPISSDGSDDLFCFPHGKYDITSQIQLIEIGPRYNG